MRGFFNQQFWQTAVAVAAGLVIAGLVGGMVGRR